MNRFPRPAVLAAWLVILAAGLLPLAGCVPAQPPAAASPALETMTATTLFFGLSRPGGQVTEAEWGAFLNDTVTPRFPDGLTVVDAYGQWKNSAGVILRESTKVLIIVHPMTPDRGPEIDAIREAYKARFQQESVLRVEGPAGVSF